MKILRTFPGVGGDLSRSPGRSEGHGGRPRAGRSRGFTLIELLVVIAIIAVLASILVPAVSKALDRARMIRCLSNEKQIGMLFQQFANDFKGLYPPLHGKMGAVYGEYANFRYWFWNLAKYLSNEEFLEGATNEWIPDDKWFATIFYAPNMPRDDLENWSLGYGMNIRVPIVLNGLEGQSFDIQAFYPTDSTKIASPTLTTLVGTVRKNWHYGRQPSASDNNPPYFDFYNNKLAPVLFADGHSVGLDQNSYTRRYSIYPAHDADKDVY